MIYLSGVLEVTLVDDRESIVVAAWKEPAGYHGMDCEEVRFLGFDPETHEPMTFGLGEIARINAVLVR